MPYYLHTKNYRDFTINDVSTDTIIKTFSNAKNAGKSLPGDIVSPTIDGCELVTRVNHHVIAGLLELSSKVRYGFSSRNVPIYLFTPFNEAYPPFVVGSSEKQPSPNRYALIRFENEWPDTFPKGHLQRLLPLESEYEALFWTYTPRACEKYRGPALDQPNIESRPLITAFHIDPSGCKDVDDVLTVETTDTTTYITITIADVASQVPADHPLDIRAASIGQTFYQATNKPMFPAEFSEIMFSLIPSTTKKAGLSLRFNINNPTEITWFESAVITQTTYTYDSIYTNKPLSAILEKMSSVLGAQSKDSHIWIEQAMKFYNTEAAKLLKANKVGLLRAHSEPDMEKLTKYTKIDPELKFLAYSSAVYVDSTAQNTYHWGLDSDAYTHITSPIRRYADLVNQRALKAIVGTTPLPQPNQALIITLNKTAKANKRHDRDYTFIQALKKEKTSELAKVVDIKTLPENMSKLTLYVPEWKQLIKLTYKNGPDNTFITKDEKNAFTALIGQTLQFTYHADLVARSWKRRLVINISAHI